MSWPYQLLQHRLEVNLLQCRLLNQDEMQTLRQWQTDIAFKALYRSIQLITKRVFFFCGEGTDLHRKDREPKTMTE